MKTHKHPDGTFTVTFTFRGQQRVHTGSAAYLRTMLQRRYGIWFAG